MSLVRVVRLAFVILGLGIATAPHTVDRTPRPAEFRADRARIQDRFDKLPLSFVENRGQVDERVAYTFRSPGHSTYFTLDGLTLRLTQGTGEEAKAHTIKVELVGAATERVESRKRVPGVVSYFNGPRDSWKTAIPTHASIGYVQPWPGIDLSYRGQGGKLESVYTVAPHADPAQIRLRYSGQDSLVLDDDGNLVLTSSVGEVRETAPILYQEIDAKRVPVPGRYALLDDNTVAFDVAKYDPDHALIIDPTLAYAGFIGGGQSDFGYGIAVDSAGNAYVTGYTNSTEALAFPVTVGPDLAYNGTEDAFVVKVSADGTTLVYAGYIGGDNLDHGRGIVVDSAGNAYVTGYTQSTEGTFPVLGGPDLTFNGAFRDAFVAKVNPAGTALIYAGYIGGDNEDEGWGIGVDSAGSAYVTGTTQSTQATFPVTGGPDLTYDGSQDAFVAKVMADGSALVYAGYIGGSGIEQGYGIAVDGAGNAYVTGSTTSTEAQGFPVTVGPDLTYNAGTNDAFVAKVNAAGNALDYAGYIGGDTDLDEGYGIAVDGDGNAYVTGYTYSSEVTFPVLSGPDLTFNGDEDVFVAEVNAAGTALTYCGYIGGSGRERGYGIAVDGDGNAYVTGNTFSTEATFPVLGGPDLTYNGGNLDAFVAKVNAAGSALDYAGYIGGGGDERVSAIAVDNAGNAYVTGSTSSTETSFPVTIGPDLTHNGPGGANDAFVAKIAEAVNTAPVAVDDTASTPENTALAIPIATLLANDTDAELDMLTLTVVTQGANGSVAIVGTDVVYTPAVDFNGMDAFDYTVEDPSNAAAMATVTVTVTPVDDPDAGVGEDGGSVSDLGADLGADATPGEDGGSPSDLGADAARGSDESEGCGCTVGGSPRSAVLGPFWLVALVMLRVRGGFMSLVRGVRHAAVILGLGIIATASHTVDRTSRPTELQADRARIQDQFGNLPLSFIENRGQTDARVAYMLRFPGHSTYFTPDGLTLRLTQGTGEEARAHTIKVELVGAATERVESRRAAPGVVSYFNGPRDSWKTAIPTHASIGYVQPWPGIDLSYRGQGGKLESVYTVAPHADPAQIRLRYSGQNSLVLDGDGNLVLTSSVGDVRETAPILYQEIDAKCVPVEGRYALLDENTVAFDVAKYDADHALVIDPTLAYAGYIGGVGATRGHGIAVDSAGNAYATGFTQASEATFPVTVGPDLTYNGGTFEAFVAKVSADGATLIYAGYIGGSGDEDRSHAIAVDSTGNAYVTGWTDSTAATFPVLGGPDLTHNGFRDAFIAKVSADGTALVYAGYIGGSGDDRGLGIALDSADNAYVAGVTTSSEADFPVIVGPDLTYNGGGDAFVAKVSADGTALVYAGYVGGSGSDASSGLLSACGIAVDSAGNAYVTGDTASTEATFPVVGGPDLTYNGGGFDAFVAKVNAAGSALDYAGYVGGSGDDQGFGIAVDGAGSAYVTGDTGSTEATFPVTIGPDLTYNGLGSDAFVAKVNAAGTALDYAGYIGGNADDEGHGIAVDSAGNAYVTGRAGSSEPTFPVLGGPDPTYNGGSSDAFVAQVNVAGTALVYAGFVGGNGPDEGHGIAVDSAGDAYVAGITSSSAATFPETVGPGLTFSGSLDTFVAKLVPSVNTPPVALDDTASTAEDTPVAIAIATLLANDTDAEFDVLTVTAVTQGGNGAVAIVGTDVVYTPAAGFSGMDAFDYTVEDPSSATSMATVTVTVNGSDAGTTPGPDGVSLSDLGTTPGQDATPGEDATPGGDDESEGCGCALGGVPRPRMFGPLLLLALLMLRSRFR